MPIFLVLIAVLLGFVSTPIQASEGGEAGPSAPCRLSRWGGSWIPWGYSWSHDRIWVEAASPEACQQAAKDSFSQSLTCGSAALIVGGNPYDSMGGDPFPCPVHRVNWRFEDKNGVVRGVIRARDL